MSRLLPTHADVSQAEESDPRVVGLDSDAADDLIAALSSDTARDLLNSLHAEPATPSELADRIDTSLQNVQYHLENLAECGTIEAIDTVYSEKGREMTVYAPADRPLVVVAGGQDETTGLRTALTGLIGGIGALAALGVLLNYATGHGFLGMQSQTGGDGGSVGAMGVDTASRASNGWLSVDLAAPGTLFFLGGLFVLVASVLLIIQRQ